MNDIKTRAKNSVRISESEIAEVRKDRHSQERSLISLKTFFPEEIITEFYWETVHSKPEIFTVQIDDDKHIDLLPGYLECLNHCCDPNCFVDTVAKKIVCLQPINPGDELTFFYPSTEWDMDEPFDCRCGNNNCLGTIKGAKYLKPADIKTHRFTDFILQKINQENNIKG